MLKEILEKDITDACERLTKSLHTEPSRFTEGKIIAYAYVLQQINGGKFEIKRKEYPNFFAYLIEVESTAEPIKKIFS